MVVQDSQPVLLSSFTTTSGTNGTTISTTTNGATTASSTRASNTTTASNTTPMATTSREPGATHRVSSGGVAGIGIGCAIAGAIIAGLIALLFIRRLKNRQHLEYHQQHLPSSGGYGEQDKGEIVVAGMSVKGGATTNLDNLLPQPAEDDAISGAMSRLRDNIKNHVQSYYHTTTVAPNVVDESRLGDLAAATRIATWTLRDLLLDPATRTPAIRLFLGWLILSRCSQDAQPSLLPSEVSASVASMPGPDATNAARLVLFSKWKAITCTLLQQRYGEQIVESDTRNRSITDAIAVADSVLHPFINTSVDMTQRHRNLEMITRRAAQFAFLLFSQPGSFHFSFTKTGQQDSLVVFPALLQTINDQAQVLSPPRVICEKEIVTGLGG